MYHSTGKITGSDMRKCVCCGGWFIDFNDSTYRFYELPDNSDINLENAVFPIVVKLNWSVVNQPCLGDEIAISSIKKVE
jgi:hypothetical protein